MRATLEGRRQDCSKFRCDSRGALGAETALFGQIRWNNGLGKISPGPLLHRFFLGRGGSAVMFKLRLLCYRIVQEKSPDSNSGQGVCFVVSLPLPANDLELEGWAKGVFHCEVEIGFSGLVGICPVGCPCGGGSALSHRDHDGDGIAERGQIFFMNRK